MESFKIINKRVNNEMTNRHVEITLIMKIIFTGAGNISA